MNKIILKGRLGKDPENYNGVVKFSVATDDGYMKDGNKIDKTNWHNIVAFGKVGEVISNHFKKGDEIIVVGRVEYNEHDGKYYTSVVLSEFEFCGSRQSNNNSSNIPYQDVNSYKDGYGDQEDNEVLPF